MPDHITVSEVAAPENAKVLRLAKRLENTFKLAVEKAVASTVNAEQYPLAADPKSLERIVLARFNRLPAEKRQAARTKVMPFVNAPLAQRAQKYNDLANVNLRSATPVARQVKALPMPANLQIGMNDLESLGNGLVGQITPGGLIQLQALNKMELRIREVRCIDETNPEDGPFGMEIDDEIALGGTKLLAGGSTGKINPFEVGDSFEDGETRVYESPRRFTTFDLDEWNQWPKTCFATLVLAEEDMGGVADFIDDLYDELKDEAVALLAGLIGAAVGLSGGPAGAVIGAVVGFVLGKVAEIISDWLGDEIFKPRTVAVHVRSANGRFADGSTTSRRYVAKFQGHGGEYDVVYDWRLFA